MSKLTTRLTAMLLSGMLVFGSAPGAVSAADAQEAPGQTSGYEEAAGDVLLEEPAEGNSGEEDPAAGSGGSADETAGELILDDTDNAAYEGDGSFEGNPGFYEDGSGSADEIAGTSDNTDDVTGPRPSEFSDITGQQPSAPFVQSYRIGGTVITLTAEVGVFPEGEIPVLESPQDDTLPQQAEEAALPEGTDVGSILLKVNRKVLLLKIRPDRNTG